MIEQNTTLYLVKKDGKTLEQCSTYADAQGKAFFAADRDTQPGDYEIVQQEHRIREKLLQRIPSREVKR